MKIICIGRNYIDHAKELSNPVPEKPVFFLKPDSAMVIKNRPFFYPEFSNDVHHEIELVIRINRLGRSISEKFAHRYYSEIGLGVDFTARDIQQEMKQKGLPWEIAKGFDYSAPVSEFISLEEARGENVGENIPVKSASSKRVSAKSVTDDVMEDATSKDFAAKSLKGETGSQDTNDSGIPFKLLKNGVIVQEGNSRDMIFSFDRIIAYVSQFMTLKTGDLIFTGTPAGVGPVAIDDHLEGYLGEKKLLDFFVK